MDHVAADIIDTATTRLHRGVDYITFLRHLDQHLKPRSYFEIGTCLGDSLRAFGCDALAVDPTMQFETHPDHNVIGARKRAFLFQMTSDAFFEDHDIRSFLPGGPDIAFLDGLHLFEFLLRDFIHAEAQCHAGSTILLHDCLPLNHRMAERAFRVVPEEDSATRMSWAGDVWRLLPILKRFRPDLQVVTFDCPPTGLVAITRLDPASTVLSQNYHAITTEFADLALEEYGMERVWTLFPMLETRDLLSRPHDLPALLTGG